MLLQVIALAAACATLSLDAPDYPPTRRADTVDDYFGTSVADPYRWLEALDSAETKAWVEAQNRLSAPRLQSLPAREAIKARLTALWNFEGLDGVPQRTRTGAVLYARSDGLKNHAVLYVQDAAGAPRPGATSSRAGPELRVLIDPNEWSADGTSAMVDWTVSPDGRWVAYAKQTAGSDWIEYRLREIATGKDGPDRVGGINFNFDSSRISWRGGGQGFFYSRFPQAQGTRAGAPAEVTGQKVYYHRLGTAQSEDTLVFEQPAEPKWFAFGETTDDGRYLLLYQERTEDSEKQVYVKDLENPDRPRLAAPTRTLISGWDAKYYLVGNEGPVLYFRTSQEASNHRIVAVDLRRPARRHWREVVPQSADAMQYATLIGGEIVVGYLHDAASRLARYSTAGQSLGEIPLPGIGTALDLTGSPADSELFYGYRSFGRPLTAYRHDLKNGSSEAFLPPRVAFDPDQFQTEQVSYRSKDGTRVPMFISYRKGLRKDGRAPTLLYGYGGFANSMTPLFSVPNIVWMERGGIYAQACLRGGAEYGEAWHQAGIEERKQNVFDDFIAAAEFLIREKYTAAGRLAIRGRSNGGLLIGAVVNQRPELFAAAHTAVGVMDMLRYHKFGIAHAWAGDYGTSDTEKGFRVLSAYSPVHNAKPGTRYPAVLVTTADHDDRVHPLHSFKYTAALQAAQAGAKPVLIRIETSAGHGAGTGLSKLIEENADVLAFLEHYAGL